VELRQVRLDAGRAGTESVMPLRVGAIAMAKENTPRAVVADADGRIFDHSDLLMCVDDGLGPRLPRPEEILALPKGSDLFLLPGRLPQAMDPVSEALITLDEDPDFGPLRPVAAFVAPAYTRLALPVYETLRNAPTLSLFAYSAVGWMHGRFYVAAVRVDEDVRQDPYRFDSRAISRGVKAMKQALLGNAVVAHVEHCALVYGCRAAQNFFLGRHEAPLPVSPSCNSACVGCISDQADPSQDSTACDAAPHERIAKPPLARDLAEVALRHLAAVPNGVVSFGQGCEGEPLLQVDVLEETTRLIRAKTQRGVINLNSNASLPRAVARLRRAGLDSMRISLNSARVSVYEAYYRPRRYSLDDVAHSGHLLAEQGGYVSLNLFIFPGVSDVPAELDALESFIERAGVQQIQMRNLNIDPEIYRSVVGPEALDCERVGRPVGVLAMMERLRGRFPFLRFGYFNPPRTKFGRPGPLPRGRATA